MATIDRVYKEGCNCPDCQYALRGGPFLVNPRKESDRDMARVMQDVVNYEFKVQIPDPVWPTSLPGTFGNGLGQLIKRKAKNMNRLTPMQKRLLDADTQTLLKAGYLDSELDLTDAGQEVLDGIMFEANKAALVAAAQARLDEESKKKTLAE